MPGFNSSKFIFRGETVRFAAFTFLSLLAHLFLFSLQFQHQLPIAVATESGIGIVERPASSFKPVITPSAIAAVRLPEPELLAERPALAGPPQKQLVPAQETEARRPVRPKKVLVSSANEPEFAELPNKPAAATEQAVRPIADPAAPLDTSQLSPLVS